MLRSQYLDYTMITENSRALNDAGEKVDIAVIDYGMGNLRSVLKACEHVGARVKLARSADEIGSARGIILPGVGAIADCVEALRSSGLAETVRDWIGDDRPFLGVCLGLQALFEDNEEADVPGLGIFPGRVKRFRLDSEYKIPHMGWNSVTFKKDCLLNAGLQPAGDQFYFVHSYYVVPDDPELIWCETDYGTPFVSGIARGNCFATQFHPEKSQAKGLQIYRNYLDFVRKNN